MDYSKLPRYYPGKPEFGPVEDRFWFLERERDRAENRIVLVAALATFLVVYAPHNPPILFMLAPVIWLWTGM